MGNKNDFLINARMNKKDEFYTQYSDIERCVESFVDSFKGKMVYCPCDTMESNFTRFFKDNFEKLGLKGLYYSSLTQPAYYYDGKEEAQVGNMIDILTDDFRLMLEDVDIVVTNPPFSCFVRFVDSIIEERKDLLVIGTQNSATCKSVFSHIMNDGLKLWYGGFKGTAGHFFVPDDYEDYAKSGNHVENMIRVSGVMWWTTLPMEYPELMVLTESYYDSLGNPDNEKYPVFDNFRKISGLDCDLINVNRTKDIPKDYSGYMAVPVSFFSKYNPDQFELVQLDHYGPLGNLDNVINGKQIYRRIIIKRN